MTLFEEFYSFVSSRPPEETYDPWNSGDCAVARFGKQKFPGQFKEAGFHKIVLKDNGRMQLLDIAPVKFRLMDAIIKSETMGGLAEKLEGILVKIRN